MKNYIQNVLRGAYAQNYVRKTLLVLLNALMIAAIMYAVGKIVHLRLEFSLQCVRDLFLCFGSSYILYFVGGFLFSSIENQINKLKYKINQLEKYGRGLSKIENRNE